MPMAGWAVPFEPPVPTPRSTCRCSPPWWGRPALGVFSLVTVVLAGCWRGGNGAVVAPVRVVVVPSRPRHRPFWGTRNALQHHCPRRSPWHPPRGHRPGSRSPRPTRPRPSRSSGPGRPTPRRPARRHPSRHLRQPHRLTGSPRCHEGPLLRCPGEWRRDSGPEERAGIAAVHGPVRQGHNTAESRPPHDGRLHRQVGEDPRQLADEPEPAGDWWLAEGQPSLCDFGMTVEPEHQYVRCQIRQRGHAGRSRPTAGPHVEAARWAPARPPTTP
ncbi:hypothetical protein GA0115260_127753 [Streptomyces sp. MnatMP-M27]|nr:hypothetical protein GA0115260_127753 [Streptomyces sp. MnatMP-M27]